MCFYLLRIIAQAAHALEQLSFLHMKLLDKTNHINALTHTLRYDKYNTLNPIEVKADSHPQELLL